MGPKRQCCNDNDQVSFKFPPAGLVILQDAFGDKQRCTAQAVRECHESLRQSGVLCTETQVRDWVHRTRRPPKRRVRSVTPDVPEEDVFGDCWESTQSGEESVNSNEEDENRLESQRDADDNMYSCPLSCSYTSQFRTERKLHVLLQVSLVQRLV